MRQIIIKDCNNCHHSCRPSIYLYCNLYNMYIPTKVDYNDLGIPVVEVPIPEWCELADYE